MKKWGFLIFLILMLLIGAGSVCAATDTEIYINGLKLETDAKPVIKDGYTFVPIRSIGEALGYTVTYYESSKTIDMTQPNLRVSIQMVIGGNAAFVNGNEVDIPAPPFIFENRTMVPVRFISEALDSRVIWEEGCSSETYSNVFEDVPNKVIIRCQYPVKLPSGNAGVASQIYEQSWELPDYANPDKKGASYKVEAVVPVFSGMRDEDFQRELNEEFKAIYENAEENINTAYEENKNTGYEYSAYYNYSFSITDDSAGVLSILAYDDYYTGGAHGFPNRYGINIAFNKSVVLELSDLFKPEKDYEQKLLGEMKAIQKLSSTQEYVDVTEVTELSSASFYFKDGNLVIFYQPYELSSFARGFVEFRIPLENLSDYLKDEYMPS